MLLTPETHVIKNVNPKTNQKLISLSINIPDVAMLPGMLNSNKAETAPNSTSPNEPGSHGISMIIRVIAQSMTTIEGSRKNPIARKTSHRRANSKTFAAIEKPMADVMVTLSFERCLIASWKTGVYSLPVFDMRLATHWIILPRYLSSVRIFHATAVSASTATRKIMKYMASCAGRRPAYKRNITATIITEETTSVIVSMAIIAEEREPPKLFLSKSAFTGSPPTRASGVMLFTNMPVIDILNACLNDKAPKRLDMTIRRTPSIRRDIICSIIASSIMSSLLAAITL